MGTKTYQDLFEIVTQLKINGCTSDIVMVHAPGGRDTNICLGRVGDSFSLDFNKRNIFNFFKYLKFLNFCEKRSFEVTEEKWGKQKMIRAKHELNEVQFIRSIKEYFLEVHGVKNDLRLNIQAMGWSTPNKDQNDAPSGPDVA